jgi:hypothetical protein
VFSIVKSAWAATLLMGALFQSTPVFAQSEPAANSILVFGGTAAEGSLVGTAFTPWSIEFADVNIVGASIAHRFGTLNEITGDFGLGRLGDAVSVEAEIGTARRFGIDDGSEVWTALYFRYDDLPWNETVYTTIALNTGFNLLLQGSDFEVDSGSGQHASRLLHYLAPEITFADPDYKNLELVVRLHHRSGIFGLMDDFISGSTFVSAGVRFRF